MAQFIPCICCGWELRPRQSLCLGCFTSYDITLDKDDGNGDFQEALYLFREGKPKARGSVAAFLPGQGRELPGPIPGNQQVGIWRLGYGKGDSEDQVDSASSPVMSPGCGWALWHGKGKTLKTSGKGYSSPASVVRHIRRQYRA